LILFGSNGDLAMRKVLRALYRRCNAKQLAPAARSSGVARTEFARGQ
jgi:glucose-6-phosphate 1-dehydrogenase